MFIGGMRALLLQSLHPLAMAGVADHSGFQGDPWGRLQRTVYFLAVTTFGTAADAEAMVAAVRASTSGSPGPRRDGRPYAASDPHLLRWVHVAEVDSFLAAHQRYGAAPLDPDGPDGYVADTARVAEALGVRRPAAHARPSCAPSCAAFRPELASTPAARDTARFLLLTPPLPLSPARRTACWRPPRSALLPRVGAPAAAAALPAGDRAAAGPRDRRGAHPDDPLGDGRAAVTGQRGAEGDAAPASPATAGTQ